MTLRVAFTSDLHVEYHLEVVGIVASEAALCAPDVLVLGGDICPDLTRLEASLRLITRSVRCPVLTLPGNHELWCGGAGGRGPDSRARYERLLPELARRAGAMPLGLAPVRVGPVTFVGVTGWHDGTLAPEHGGERAGGSGAAPPAASAGGTSPEAIADASALYAMDDRQVHWPDEAGEALDREAITAYMRSCLGQQLESLGESPGPVVVVTHVLPHRELVEAAESVEARAVAPYLGSATFWPVIAGHPGVAQVLCGHLHQPLRISLPGLRGPLTVEISPVGYPRECHSDLEQHVASRLTVIEVS